MSGTSNNKKYLIWFWSIFAFPFVFITIILVLISRGKLGPMPSFTELENPEYFLDAQVLSDETLA